MIYTIPKFVAVLALSLTMGVGGAWAQSSETTPNGISQQDSASRKINLAGRQRMLSQHMSKDVCFAEVGVEAEKHRAALEQASWLFQTTLKDLRDGSDVQGMLPETDPEIVAALNEVSQHWLQISTAMNGWSLGYGDTSASLGTIFDLNIPLLKSSHRVVGLLEATYGGAGVVSAYKAAAVNISGRQRMLSQKMTKEFCLVSLGYKADENVANLAKTMETFEASHKALMLGAADVGLTEAAPEDIRKQLEKVASFYGKLAPSLSKAVEGAPVTETELKSVAQLNLIVLTEMDKAVHMFEKM